MKKRLLTSGILIVATIGWAGAAVAVEGGWFDRIDQLERSVETAEEDAQRAQSRAAELDAYLAEEITDPETARRATEQLRRDVSVRIADWDSAQRKTARVAVTNRADDSRAMAQTLDIAGAPIDDEWREQVELLREVDEGIEYTEALMIRRGRFEIDYAHDRAVAEQARQNLRYVADEASSAEHDDEVQAEIDALAEELDATLRRLHPLPSEDDFHRNKGALLPPVRALPDHPFGPRQRSDSYTEVRHTGVTYLIDVGTEVRTVAEGTIVSAQRLPGFGNTVIVDHGDEYHSVYAHLDEFEAQEGDELNARDVLGHSGESGSIEGPKLYFELRRQGQPVDPEEWFVSD